MIECINGLLIIYVVTYDVLLTTPGQRPDIQIGASSLPASAWAIGLWHRIVVLGAFHFLTPPQKIAEVFRNEKLVFRYFDLVFEEQRPNVLQNLFRHQILLIRTYERVYFVPVDYI